MKILIMGLPGSGKTSLAVELSKLLKAVHWNADEVRSTISRDLGFSIEDRITHARRMSWLCDTVSKAGQIAVADFVCPTVETRKAFAADFTIWMDTIAKGRYEDTNLLFQNPTNQEYTYRISSFDCVNHAKDFANVIKSKYI